MNKSSSGTSTSSSDGSNSKEPLVEQAKHAVTHVAEQAKEQVTSQLTTQFDAKKESAVETIGSVAEAIRGTSEKLKGVGPLGDVAGRAADGMEKLGKFFDGKDIGDLVQEANRFARREPAMFLGAAFVVGLIGGRFLKSSSRPTPGAGPSSAYASAGGGERSYGVSSYGDRSFVSDAELDQDLQSYGSSNRHMSQMRPAQHSPPMRSAVTQGSPPGASGITGRPAATTTATQGGALGPSGATMPGGGTKTGAV